MTSTFTRGIRGIALLCACIAAALFLIGAPAPAAAADDAATAIFGPTIDNVPWKYIPEWYKAELLASGYQAPEDPSMPPVAPPAVVTEVYGPTIANVPWEYVPDWYKAELATRQTQQRPSVSSLHTLPSTDLPALNELDETEMIGKETAAPSDEMVEEGSFDDADAKDMTEARSSFMSETSFFFLVVFLIFVTLILVSAFKNRSRAAAQQDE